MNEYLTAVIALKKVVNDGNHLDHSIPGDATPLAQQICYGVTRHYYFLDQVVDHLLSKPLPDKHIDLRLLLMCGLYSIDNLRRPAHASVNAAVNTTKLLKKDWARGLINGVLRTYGRQASELAAQVTNDSIEARLNHPGWLIDELAKTWDLPAIIKANQARGPLTLRINARKTTRESYIKLLAEQEINGRAGQLSDSCVTLSEAMPAHQIPGFDDGLVSVQDEGAQLAAELLDLRPGMHVLDACAAPGGKTCHILEVSDVTLTSLDRDKKRIPHIKENLTRLGLSAEVVTAGFEHFEPGKVYDRILLDAPCSATGIIRRHPDIKLLRTKSDIAKLANIQRALLNKAFDLLGNGGELLYSTCSILPVENDEVIAAFLQDQPNATCQPVIIRTQSDSYRQTEFGIQLLPTTDQHDGFYYSKLAKKGLN